MHDYYLLLGANLGERYQTLTFARAKLAHEVGEIISVSAVYATEAWGTNSQNEYLNQAVWIRSSKSPMEALDQILAIELEAGRVRTERWADRTLDIDILACEAICMNTEKLTLPHPELQNRRFALVPLAEIAPEWRHPIFHSTTLEMLYTCKDKLNVTRIDKPL